MKIMAKNTDQHGNVAIVPMELEHYLRAAKVQPDRFAPADAKSEAIVKKIPMEVVPVGTTLKDVEEFEKTRGSKKGKAKSRFEQMLALVNAGKEIEVLEEENSYAETLNQVTAAIDAPDGYTSPIVETKPGEIKSDAAAENKGDDDVDENIFNKENKQIQDEENKSDKTPYDLESLKKLSLDQLQATVMSAKLPKGISTQLLKLKNKEKLAQDFFKYTSENIKG